MIHRKRSFHFVILLSVVAITICFGAGCRPTTGPPEKVTIAYAETPSAGLIHIAFVKGYFTEEGLDATAQPHAFGKQSLDAVIEGKADLGTTGDTPFMLAVMGEKKITTVATIMTANKNTAIIVRQDQRTDRPIDLKGKVIGATPGTTGDFFVDIFLVAYGIERKQIRIVGLKPDEMSFALKSGSVDAVSVWNPVLIQIQKELGDKVRIYYGESFYTEHFCLAAGQEYVRKHPEVIKKILRALIKAEGFMQHDPGESKRIVAKFLKVDSAIIDEVWDTLRFRVTLEQALLVDFEDQTRWALRNHLTVRRDMPNYLDFIYSDGLLAAKPEAVRIIR